MDILIIFLKVDLCFFLSVKVNGCSYIFIEYLGEGHTHSSEQDDRELVTHS